MPYVRRWLLIPIPVFVLAVALGLVAAHTSLTQPHELHLDRLIQTDTRSATLTPVMLAIADIAGPVGGVIILAVWVGWLLLVGRRPVRAVATFLVVGIGWNITEVAKVIVARHRPPTVYSLAPETGSNSFPSGHVSFTLSAAVAAYFLARGTRWRWPVAIAGALAVLVVIFDRLYIGAHYPIDVLGSVLVSSATIACLTGVWHRWLLPRLPRVPVLGRFGPLTEDDAPVPERQPGRPSGRHTAQAIRSRPTRRDRERVD
jgi:membrane-associated phospholipid phosphatase